jgi:hypothetical protein
VDAVIALPSLSKPQLLAFNRCRLFFGVTYLSEVSTADGTAIASDAWDGSRHRCSPLLWPYQPMSGPKSFRVWRRLLATAFLQDHRPRVSIRTRNLTLRRKLRRWLPGSEAFRYQWTTFYSVTMNSLFALNGDGATFNTDVAEKNRRRPKHPIRAFVTSPDATAETLPNDAVPVDSWSEPNKIVIPALVTDILGASAPPRSPSTWGGYLRTLLTWEQNLLVCVQILDRSQLLTALRQEDLLFQASDGGARDKKTSFGAVIATGDTILAESGRHVEGAYPGSFRAERYGILAISRSSTWPVTDGSAFGCTATAKAYCCALRPLGSSSVSFPVASFSPKLM